MLKLFKFLKRENKFKKSNIVFTDELLEYRAEQYLHFTKRYKETYKEDFFMTFDEYLNRTSKVLHKEVRRALRGKKKEEAQNNRQDG